MAKKHIWVYTVLIAISLHVCSSVNAQRTMDGQYFAQAECLWSGGTPGGSAAFGQYLLNSAWQAGAAMRSYSRTISTGETLCVSDIVAFGEWDYRLFAISVCMQGGVSSLVIRCTIRGELFQSL